MHSLPVFLRLVGRPVIVIGDGEAARAKRRILERAGAVVVGEDQGAALAIVALDEDVQARDAVARLKARGILVNAVDRPELCDFTLPAIVDRNPVIVAIGTGGASAGLAKALRQRLERILPQSLGPLAAGLATARAEMRRRWPDAAERRRAIDAALDERGSLDPLQSAAAEDAIARWLNAPDALSLDRLETLHIMSDDPDALTLAQARLLGQADTVYHSSMIAAAILDRARADAIRIEIEQVPDALAPGLNLHLVRTPQQ